MLSIAFGSCAVCDPAGPGMDCNPEITLGLPVSDAAVQTQTLHVSIDKGSMVRSSQIDWLIGKCGIHQPNSTTSAPYNSLPLPYGVPMFSMDHICCPNFYNWAFDIVYKPSNMNKDCCVIGKERFPSHPELVSDGCRVGYWLKDSPDWYVLINILPLISISELKWTYQYISVEFRSKHQLVQLYKHGYLTHARL